MLLSAGVFRLHDYTFAKLFVSDTAALAGVDEDLLRQKQRPLSSGQEIPGACGRGVKSA